MSSPAPYMVHAAEQALPASTREQIPERAEQIAAQSLATGYGVTFGALYAALRPRGGSALAEGAALGVACWAAGYLGWLPAAGLMPPVWRQEPLQVAAPIARHAAYGVATVAAYDWLRESVGAEVREKTKLARGLASSRDTRRR